MSAQLGNGTPSVKTNVGVRGGALFAHADIDTPRLTNVGEFGVYKSMGLPTMPVCFAYDPTENQARYAGGPGINVAVKLDPPITEGQLPPGIKEQLPPGFNLNDLEVNFCVQDTPWKPGTPIMYRPHAFVHPNAPDTVAAGANYDKVSNPAVGLADINSPMGKLSDVRIHTHNIQPESLVRCSPGPPDTVIQQVDANGNRNNAANNANHAFYSLCVTEDPVTKKKRAALTLHWLVNEADHNAINKILREEDLSPEAGVPNNQRQARVMTKFMDQVSLKTTLDGKKSANDVFSPVGALRQLVNGGPAPHLIQHPAGSQYVIDAQPKPVLQQKAGVAGVPGAQTGKMAGIINQFQQNTMSGPAATKPSGPAVTGMTPAHAHQREVTVKPLNEAVVTHDPNPMMKAPEPGKPAHSDLKSFYADMMNIMDDLRTSPGQNFKTVENDNKLTFYEEGKNSQIELQRNPNTGGKAIKILGDWREQKDSIEAIVLACKKGKQSFKLAGENPEFSRECLKYCIKHDLPYTLLPETEKAINERYGSKGVEGVNNLVKDVTAEIASEKGKAESDIHLASSSPSDNRL